VDRLEVSFGGPTNHFLRIAASLDQAVISSVNLSEVASKALDHGGTLDAVSAALSQLPIQTIPFDTDDAYRASSLRPSGVAD
jgi:PIN domain nuclease of toxin-antitoxin system